MPKPTKYQSEKRCGEAKAIGSDDPAYMEDVWLNNSLHMLRELCHFTDDDFVALQRYAIDICWASADVKREILAELQEYQKQAL